MGKINLLPFGSNNNNHHNVLLIRIRKGIQSSKELFLMENVAKLKYFLFKLFTTNYHSADTQIENTTHSSFFFSRYFFYYIALTLLSLFFFVLHLKSLRVAAVEDWITSIELRSNFDFE